MPFRPWHRSNSSSGSDRADEFARELDRLCADSRVHAVFDWFSRHEREIADFQLAITAIPAPSFAEQARAEWLRERLEPLGLLPAIDACGNLLASRPAWSPEGQPAKPQPSEPQPGSHPGVEAPGAIAIAAHLDTVFPASTVLDVRREQNLLFGPGICDNGAGLAALWALAAAFHHAAIDTIRPLLFVANVGEEGEGNLMGMRHIYREQLDREHQALGSEAQRSDAQHSDAPHSKAQRSEAGPSAAPPIAALIALDGAGTGSIISQALGSRRFEVVITGPGGHSWSDFGAPNPVVAAASAVRALWRIPLPINPRTTLNVASIEGGSSVNAIPARAVVKIDLRSADSRRLDEFEQHLRRAFAEACAELNGHAAHPGVQPGHRLEFAIRIIGERPAGELSAASPLLAAIRAVDTRLGIQSQIQRASTDANIPLSLGLEAVSLGAGGGGGGAHTLHEWFDPAGREQGLRRLALVAVLLAGLAPAGRQLDASSGGAIAAEPSGARRMRRAE